MQTSSRHSRLVRQTGADNDYFHFSTPSWTTPGVEYDLAINRRNGEITCNCPDAACRKKRGDLLNLDQPGCKHITGLIAAYRSLLAGD